MVTSDVCRCRNHAMPIGNEIVVESCGPFESVYADGTRGPFHDFILLRYDKNPLNDWETTFHDFCAQKHGGPKKFEDVVCLSDNVLVVLQGHLDWTKTLTAPYRAIPSKPSKGLHWYGPTIIDVTGAATLSTIFGAWAQLLEIGPDPVEQQIPCIRYDVVENDGQTAYELKQIVVTAPKTKIVDDFRTIQRYAQKVADNPSEYYVAHLGI